MDQAVAAIRCNVSGQIAIGWNIFQINNVNGGFSAFPFIQSPQLIDETLMELNPMSRLEVP